MPACLTSASTSTSTTGFVAGTIVEADAVDCDLLAAGDGERVYGGIKDVEAFDDAIGTLLYAHEFGLGSTAIPAAAVPVGFAVAIYDIARGADDFGAGAVGHHDEDLVGATA